MVAPCCTHINLTGQFSTKDLQMRPKMNNWPLERQMAPGTVASTLSPAESSRNWRDMARRVRSTRRWEWTEAEPASMAIAHWIGKHGSLQLRVLKSAVGGRILNIFGNSWELLKSIDSYRRVKMHLSKSRTYFQSSQNDPPSLAK